LLLLAVVVVEIILRVVAAQVVLELPQDFLYPPVQQLQSLLVLAVLGLQQVDK
jgi:hypothetical protein